MVPKLVQKKVTQHNWVCTIYHHKLLVTYFDRTTVFWPWAVTNNTTLANAPSPDNLRSAFTFLRFHPIVGELSYETLFKLETQAIRNAVTIVFTYQRTRSQTHPCHTHHRDDLIYRMMKIKENPKEINAMQIKNVRNTRNRTHQTHCRAILIFLATLTIDARDSKRSAIGKMILYFYVQG